ncbi:hypothetical protein WDW86_12885 [Bdellovibrionota bacterium FG-2]
MTRWWVHGIAFTLLVLGVGLSEMPGITGSSPPQVALVQAVSRLGSSRSGKELLERARHYWRLNSSSDVLSRITWGLASRTDAVLTRSLDPRTGKERRTRDVTVFIRQGQTLVETVLDIAHELVHATAPPAWDPYDPELTPGRYMLAAIEGEGGEVEAVAQECEVASQIFPSDAITIERCGRYVAAGSMRLPASVHGEMREMIRRDFYRSGKWFVELQKNLGPEKSMFPLLSKDSPVLYSSTGNAPYPAALMHEYRELNLTACKNTLKRLDTETQTMRFAQRFLEKRCED